MNNFTLPNLNFAKNALMPFISEETISFHYEKHHATYLKNMNTLIENTEYADLSLQDIILQSYNDNKAIFNNAAQFYNHNLYWLSIAPKSQKVEPSAKLQQMLERDFGSIEKFNDIFGQLAVTQFGSGWAWLCYSEKDSKLHAIQTSNAENPLTEGMIPLLTIDVWEHAYYLDYQNQRPKYVSECISGILTWENANKIIESI